MWFDARAKLAEIEARPPATIATPATMQANPEPRVAEVASVATPQRSKSALRVAKVAGVATPSDLELIRDLLEERAAIREFDGGQTQAEAEAGALDDVSRSTGIAAADLSRFGQSAQ